MSHPLCFLAIIATQLHLTVQSSGIHWSPNIDLGLIIHGDNDANYRLPPLIAWTFQYHFPNIFQWAQDGTRVGVVVNMPPSGGFSTLPAPKPEPENNRQTQLPIRFEWSVAIHLTGKKESFVGVMNAFQDKVSHYNPRIPDESWYNGFKVAEERLFVDEPGEIQRPRVILLITESSAGSLNVSLHNDEFSLMAARNMRERGIHMFALYKYDDLTLFGEAQRRLTSILGDGDNLKHVDVRIEAECNAGFRWLKGRIVDALCGREQRCFFLKPQKECQKAWYTPNLTDAQGNCTKLRGFTTPSSNEADDKSCSVDECKVTCDHLWPINCSESNCGKEPRKGLPRWDQLLNCDRTVKCPACPITQTPSPQYPQDPKSTTCYEKNPPAFYYDDFDGALRSAGAGGWVILVAVLIVFVGRLLF